MGNKVNKILASCKLLCWWEETHGTSKQINEIRRDWDKVKEKDKRRAVREVTRALLIYLDTEEKSHGEQATGASWRQGLGRSSPPADL